MLDKILSEGGRVLFLMPNARRACDTRRSHFVQILVVLTSLETSTRPEAINYQ
jgi:hypothetical protein